MRGTRRLRVGIAAMYNSDLGYGGGLDIYTRQLVEALAAADPHNEYVVLLYNTEATAWTHRAWPAHVRFHLLRGSEARRSVVVRAYQRSRRLLGMSVPPREGEPYLVRQIGGLNLDLLHYPGTLIFPLSVTGPCALTFFDLQHEYYPQFFTPAELEWRRRHYRASADKAVHLLVPSNFTRQSMMEKYGIAAEKMSLVPVAVQEGFGPAGQQEVERVRAKFRLPERYIFYPANPWAHKNHARLMAALRLHGERYGEVPSLVLSGRLLSESRDAGLLAAAAGVEQFVTDLGFVPPEDMPALYTGAAMLVFPSLFEGFGIPLLEAMACGCPIAAANATAIPECVGEAALLFDPFDPLAIATAIHAVLTDSALGGHLSAKGRERLGQFSWPRIVPQIVEIYRKVAESRRPGGG